MSRRILSGGSNTSTPRLTVSALRNSELCGLRLENSTTDPFSIYVFESVFLSGSHLFQTKQQSFRLTASPLERAANPAIYRRILVSVLSLRAADWILRTGCGEHLRVCLRFSFWVARTVNAIVFGGSRRSRLRPLHTPPKLMEAKKPATAINRGWLQSECDLLRVWSRGSCRQTCRAP